MKHVLMTDVIFLINSMSLLLRKKKHKFSDIKIFLLIYKKIKHIIRNNTAKQSVFTVVRETHWFLSPEPNRLRTKEVTLCYEWAQYLNCIRFLYQPILIGTQFLTLYRYVYKLYGGQSLVSSTRPCYLHETQKILGQFLRYRNFFH